MTDQSAGHRLLQDFGLLILEPSFSRYFADKDFERGILMTDGRPPSEIHLRKFEPLLPFAVEKLDPRYHPFTRYIDELTDLEWIEDVLSAFQRTLDFDLEIRDFVKSLKRKFEGSNAIHVRLNSKRILSEEVISNCRTILGMIDEFSVEDVEEMNPFSQEYHDAVLADVNIYSVLLDAEKWHREQGVLHFTTLHYLENYQSVRGNRPRKYLKVMFCVLIAEFYEKLASPNTSAHIDDLSEGHQKDSIGRIIVPRKPYFDSPVARLIVEFSKISEFVDEVGHDSDELSYYRDFLQHRSSKENFPNITKLIKSSATGADLLEIISLLDSIK